MSKAALVILLSALHPMETQGEKEWSRGVTLLINWYADDDN